jgi:hypothetical protein
MAPLRCLYVDLDGTLLGAGASLFHDGAGAPTSAGAEAVLACHRAGVEVVIYSGRREAQVHEDARLLGSRAYVFEAGACVVDGGERHWLTHPFVPESGGASVWEQVEATGAPARLRARYAPDLEDHAPWHRGRAVSHLFRGRVDLDEAGALVAADGLRLIDNGGAETFGPGWRAYHLVPAGVSKGGAVARHMELRGYAADECVAIGDSREDLTAGDAVGTFWFVANAVARDPVLGDLAAGRADVRVTAAAHGAGVLEAVGVELAERAGAG